MPSCGAAKAVSRRRRPGYCGPGWGSKTDVFFLDKSKPQFYPRSRRCCHWRHLSPDLEQLKVILPMGTYSFMCNVAFSLHSSYIYMQYTHNWSMSPLMSLIAKNKFSISRCFLKSSVKFSRSPLDATARETFFRLEATKLAGQLFYCNQTFKVGLDRIADVVANLPVPQSSRQWGWGSNLQSRGFF